MAKFPEVPEAEIQKCFPDGLTIRDEAKALAAYALLGFLEATPLEELLADERITEAEKDKVFNFAVRKLGALLDLRKKNPKRYRRTVINLAWAQLKRRRWQKR